MATKEDLGLRRRKKAQAYLSAGSAALGVGALGAMGTKAGAGKLVRAGSKTGALRRPVSVDSVRSGADRAMNRLTVGSVGLGGISSANFASVQNREAKKIKKNYEVTTMDFGLSTVRQGKSVEEIAKAMSAEEKAGRRNNRKVLGEHKQKGAVRGATTGAVLGGTAAAFAGSKGLRWGARATGRLVRRGESLPTAIKGGNLMRKETNRRAFIPPSTSINTAAGGAIGASIGNEAGLRRGAKKALKDPRWDKKYPISKYDGPVQMYTRAVPKKERRKMRRANAAVGGVLGGATGGMLASEGGGRAAAAGAGIGAVVGAGAGAALPPPKTQTFLAPAPRKIEKAYDPERSRRKRMTAYSHGAAAAAGAGGLAGGVLVQRGAKGMKAAKSVPKLKAAARTTGKGAAVSMGALGAGLAAHRINSYKDKGGASYRPRYIAQ